VTGLPSTEICNGIDDDCNGTIDDNCQPLENEKDNGERDKDRCALSSGGDPVDVISGNFHTNPQRDFRIQTENVDLDFYRIYNSQKNYDGPVGYGWTHSYNIIVNNISDGRVLVTREDGKTLYFTPDGSGGYIPPRGLNYQLSLVGGAFRLTNPQGKNYFFDNNLGRLDKITSPAGGNLTFTYYPQGRLDRITSSEGPELILHYYDENGKISYITTASGETLAAYSYYGDNYLTEVNHQNGTITQYSYDPYSNNPHNLLYIGELGSSGENLTTLYILYDESSRVKRLTSNAWGRTMDFFYHPDQSYTEIVEWNEAIGTIKQHSVYYDPDLGVSTSIEGDCGCGGSNDSEWDSSENNLNRTKFTDKNGNETHYQNYDERGNPGKIIDALGNETFYAYHPVLNTPLYIINASVIGGTESNKITIYDYDPLETATDPYVTNNPSQFNQHPTQKLHRLIEKGFTYDESGQAVPYTYVTTYEYEQNFLSSSLPFLAATDGAGNVYIYEIFAGGGLGPRTWVGKIDLIPPDEYPYPAIADFDQDGDLDIAVHDQENVYLLVNQGLNLFSSPVLIASGLSLYPYWYNGTVMVPGDFNGDGRDDLAIKAQSVGPLILLINQGNLVFQASTSIALPYTGSSITGMAAGDFNEDKKLDLIVSYYQGMMYLLFGDGSGNFPTGAWVPMVYGNCPGTSFYTDIQATVVGDFNGDGHLDVLAGQNDDIDPGQAYLFLGDGAGNLTLSGIPCGTYYPYLGYDTNPGAEYYSENQPGSGYACAYDFNGDGILDIMAQAYNWLMTFTGNGDGSFGPLSLFDQIGVKIAAPAYPPEYGIINEGKLLKIDGPRTDVTDITAFEYYPDTPDQGYNRGRLKTVTDSTGGVTRYENYDLYGNPTKITDSNGRVTLNGYDLRGRLTSNTQKEAGPSGEDLVTQYALDGLGSIRQVTFPNGESIDYQYQDYTHYLMRIIQGTQSVNYGYAFGNQLYDGMNVRHFDANNRLIHICNPNYYQDPFSYCDYYTEFAYDANGNRTSMTDDIGNATTYEYDALNRLVQVSSLPAGQPLSVLASYQYDSHDNLIQVSQFRAPDPLLPTNYLYDDMGRLLKIESPDSGTTRFQYDEAGNLIAKFDANGKAFQYQYDPMNRIVILSDSEGSQVSYVYDQGANEKGRLSTVTDPSGSSSYEYDQRGNLTNENKILGSLPFALSYSYDANGNLTSITYPSGRVVDYQYDSGLVSGVNATLNGSSTTLASNFTYDGNLLSGKATHFVYGNGLEYVMWFNARYNPWFFVVGAFAGEELAQVTAARFYSYDPVDNIIGFDQYDSFEDLNQGNTAQTDQFGYDPLNRLISAEGSYYGDLDFGYDLSGNRIGVNVDETGYVYGYYPGTDRLESVTEGAFVAGLQGLASQVSSGLSGVSNNLTTQAPNLSRRLPFWSANHNIIPSPLRGRGRGEGVIGGFSSHQTTQPPDFSHRPDPSYRPLSLPDNFDDCSEEKLGDFDKQIGDHCEHWKGKIPEDVKIQLKYLKMLIEIKLYALKLSSPSFKSGSSNVGEPLCRLPSGRFYKPEHGKPCPPPPPPPQVTAGEFVGKVREVMYESGLNVPLMFRTWMKKESLAGLVQGLLTLSGDNPASLVTKDELGQVKQFVKLAMKIKIAEVMRSGTTYAYDGNGNIITADNISYEYDSQNRMAKALVNSQPMGEYSYDAMSRRVKKTAYGVTTYSIYDQFSNLIAESDASGNITKEYIYLNSRPLAFIDLPLPSSAPPPTISGQVSRGCGTIFAWNPKEGILGYVFILSPFLFVIFFKFTRSSKKSFILLLGFLVAAGVLGFFVLPREAKGQNETEQIYYYHVDHLGTPIKLTDQNQNVVWSWQYGPFGEEPLTMEPNVISQNLRFPGQYYDAETGLHYNYHRYYSPKLGRYLTPDPVMRQNLYVYVNNPIRYTDPLGLWTSEGHTNLTYRANIMLGDNGFYYDDIQNIIKGDISVDKGLNYFRPDLHYEPNTQVNAENNINNQIQKALQYELSENHDQAMIELGKGLHTLQDYYSHYLTDYYSIEHVPGYLDLMPNYDYQSENPTNYLSAEIASENYLRKFLKDLKKQQCLK